MPHCCLAILGGLQLEAIFGSFWQALSSLLRLFLAHFLVESNSILFQLSKMENGKTLSSSLTLKKFFMLATDSIIFFLFECFPKYICTKFLISNIHTNRSILIHHQFVRESLILTWTVNFEPGPFRFKLVFEEINLSNSF